MKYKVHQFDIVYNQTESPLRALHPRGYEEGK